MEGVSVQSGSSLVSVETTMTSHMPPHTQGRKEERIIGVGTPLCVCIDWLDCNYQKKPCVIHPPYPLLMKKKWEAGATHES